MPGAHAEAITYAKVSRVRRRTKRYTRARAPLSFASVSLSTVFSRTRRRKKKRIFRRPVPQILVGCIADFSPYRTALAVTVVARLFRERARAVYFYEISRGVIRAAASICLRRQTHGTRPNRKSGTQRPCETQTSGSPTDEPRVPRPLVRSKERSRHGRTID